MLRPQTEIRKTDAKTFFKRLVPIDQKEFYQLGLLQVASYIQFRSGRLESKPTSENDELFQKWEGLEPELASAYEPEETRVCNFPPHVTSPAPFCKELLQLPQDRGSIPRAVSLG